MTNWDAELKKIDKQLESMSDSALIPAPAKEAPPATKAAVVAERESTRTWPALLRLALATALAVGILSGRIRRSAALGSRDISLRSPPSPSADCGAACGRGATARRARMCCRCCW